MGLSIVWRWCLWDVGYVCGMMFVGCGWLFFDTTVWPQIWHACADIYSHLKNNKKFDPPTPGGFRGLSIVKSFATNVIILTRDESPLVYRALVVSEYSNFDLPTALFHVTMYRQFARKVGTSANSALIRYYLPRLKLSSSTRVSEGTNA